MTGTTRVVTTVFVSKNTTTPVFAVPELVDSVSTPEIEPIYESPDDTPAVIRIVDKHSGFVQPEVHRSEVRGAPAEPEDDTMAGVNRFLLFVSLQSNIVSKCCLGNKNLLTMSLGTRVRRLLNIYLLLQNRRCQLIGNLKTKLIYRDTMISLFSLKMYLTRLRRNDNITRSRRSLLIRLLRLKRLNSNFIRHRSIRPSANELTRRRNKLFRLIINYIVIRRSSTLYTRVTYPQRRRLAIRRTMIRACWFSRESSSSS